MTRTTRRTFIFGLLLVSSAQALPQALESLLSSANSVIPHNVVSWSKRDNTTSTISTGNSSVPNTTSITSLWALNTTYSGQTFFDDWWFYTGSDPTNGLVQFVDKDTAINESLAYVTQDGTVIMQGDNTTTLPMGVNRKSVRIQSNAAYNGGLFILDLNRAPWGCGVWPAFWSLGRDAPWPTAGEIDIMEGVHDNVHNQVTWHTLPGCSLVSPGNFTGTAVGQLDCDATINSNSGCGITDWSRVSYGESFDAQGGGIYAMKWDETGIDVWYFYRVSIPQDILDGVPDPTQWAIPSAQLAASGCDPFKFFNNHALVFDITFCGDWAGNTYATTPGCPGTCQEHLQDPTNFVNASWSINSLKIYSKQQINGVVTSAAPHSYSLANVWALVYVSLATSFLAILYQN